MVTPAVTKNESSVHSTTVMSEARRAQLREVELKVIKYQDELEAARKGADSGGADKAISEVSTSCFDFKSNLSSFLFIAAQLIAVVSNLLAHVHSKDETFLYLLLNRHGAS